MLQSVAFIVRVDPRISALDHVHLLISDYLDVSALFSPPDAATKGNVSLFQRVLKRVLNSSDIDPLLRYHWFGKAMENAIEAGYLDIVKLIHEAHPASLAVQSFKIAVKAGQLEILQWLHEHRCDGLCIDVPPAQKDPQSMRCCLQPPPQQYIHTFDRVRVLRWLYETGYTNAITADAGDIAASHGDLEMVQWLEGRGFPNTFTSEAIDAAATHGYTKILRFLCEKGYKFTSEKGMVQAMARGHTDVVKYLAEQGMWTVAASEALAVAAAEHGRIDLLERCKRYLSEPAVRAKLMNAAVSNGQMQVAQWLGKCSVDATALHSAASRGHSAMVQWVHEHDYGKWEAWLVSLAAVDGRLDIVKWFYEQRPRLFAESEALRAAAEGGNLRLVKWIYSHGQDVCLEAVYGAVANGRLELAKWLFEHRGGFCVSLLTRADYINVANSGHLEMLMWLHDQGCQGLTRENTLQAPPDVQMWLHDVLGFPITEELVTHAASVGDLAFMQWLYTRSDLRVDPSHQHPHLRHWMGHHRRDGDE